jgi:capsular polysaccharide biosynthesis protein
VITICALLPVLAVIALQSRQAPEYMGSVRIQVVSAAPSSTTEADAVSSRVLALATTPSLVARALQDAGLSGDPADVAQHHVTASRLGESPVVDVSVTDADQARAGALAGALVKQVVAFMNSGSRPDLDARLRALNAEIASAEAQRQELTDRISHTGSPLDRQALVVRVQAAEDQVNQLATQRSGLLQTKLSVDQAVVIDGDNPQVRQVASSLVPRSALALVLGLIVGLAVAVLIETVSPRVAGVRALARSLRAPLLGRSDEPSETLATSMSMAARRQGVETIVMMGIDENDRVATDQLLSTLPAADPPAQPAKLPAKAASAARNGRPRAATQRPGIQDPFVGTSVQFRGLAQVEASAEHSAGVVVVSSGSSRTRDLDLLEDRLTALRWPVVGIVQVTRGTRSSAS